MATTKVFSLVFVCPVVSSFEVFVVSVVQRRRQNLRTVVLVPDVCNRSKSVIYASKLFTRLFSVRPSAFCGSCFFSC